jgi:hypothetical protein
MTRTRRLMSIGAAVALVAGCGLGRAEGLADRVMAAADLTAAAPALRGTLRGELRSTAASTTVAVLALADQPAPVDLEVAVVAGERHAALRRDGVDVALFDDDRILVRRPEATAADARPWLEVHLTDVRAGATAFDPADYKAGATYALVSVLDPRLLLDIAASPLSGSVRDLGPVDIDGQHVQHLRANFDVDKALDNRRRKSYDLDRRERVRRVLDLLSMSRTVNPGEVWLDDTGVRRVQLELRVRPSQYATSRLTVTIDLTGAAAPIAMPDRRHTVVVDSLAALQRSAAQLGTVPRV